MITLLVLILIVLVVGFGCVIAAIVAGVDTIVETVLQRLGTESAFTPAIKTPLRPGSHDTTTLEDLQRARTSFESGKPEPLPPLGKEP